MDLEQRVNLLEQEVKLLKTEIQATLLDIQEQLLSTRFSELRADDGRQAKRPGAVSVGPDLEIQAPQSARPAILKVVTLDAEDSPAPGAPAGQLAAADEETSEPATVLPAASRPMPAKSAPPARPAPARATPAPAVPAPAAPAANGSHKPAALPGPKTSTTTSAESPIDWETMRQLTDWTLQTVRKFGPERTRRLIEVYTHSGFLPAGVGAVLQRVAGAFQPEVTPARNMNLPGKTVSEPVETITALDQAQQRDIMRRIISRLQKSNARQGTSHG